VFTLTEFNSMRTCFFQISEQKLNATYNTVNIENLRPEQIWLIGATPAS